MADNVLKVEATAPDPAVIDRAASVLRSGGLVAFPTETVYGLGADAFSETAVRRIFEAKGRPAFNPIIVHVPDVDGARGVTSAWPEMAAVAAAAFWPGPLTLVLPKHERIPGVVTAGLDTVAVRVPSHPVALALLRAAGLPVAAPSANLFTRISPTTAEHVARGLGGRADLILDGGATPYGIESTVLDLTGVTPRVLRPGVIDAEELERVLGPVIADSMPDGEAGEALPSPGMMSRHYSPAAEVVVFEDAAGGAALADRAMSRRRRVGALLLHPLPAELDEVVAMPTDAHGYARLLYASLHTLDDAGCDLILVEQVPAAPNWAGVRDRLRRAAPAGR
jgi:L-threonylcarbamoyladenylate synthase